MAQDSRILIAFPDRQLAAMAEVLETPPFFFNKKLTKFFASMQGQFRMKKKEFHFSVP